ncbi:hypothetical protein PENSUB_13125, partial [Penicillium subrubescens]
MSQLLPIPTMLDRRAEAHPDRVWVRHPVGTSYTKGFQAATYGQMRTAVNRVARLLKDKLGESQSFETLAYVGPNDLRYHIVLVAVIKLGYKEQMFFPSPRNSIVAQKELIARTKCRILLTPDPEPPLVTGFVRENTTSTIQIPSLKELFKHDDTIIPYVYVYEQKPLDVIRDQPVLILHTSGSTVRRSSDFPDAQSVFALSPDLEEFETRDLFSPHPELPDLWMHRGRRDDLIVLLNREKTNPISFEAEITAHPDVRGALVAGNKRVEACLIAESIPEALQQVAEDTSAKENFAHKIWLLLRKLIAIVQLMPGSP